MSKSSCAMPIVSKETMKKIKEDAQKGRNVESLGDFYHPCGLRVGITKTYYEPGSTSTDVRFSLEHHGNSSSIHSWELQAEDFLALSKMFKDAAKTAKKGM